RDLNAPRRAQSVNRRKHAIIRIVSQQRIQVIKLDNGRVPLHRERKQGPKITGRTVDVRLRHWSRKSNLLQFQGNSSLVKRVEGSTPVGGAILVGGVVGDVAGLHSLAAKAVYFPGCILVRHSNLGLGRAI